MNQKLKLVSMLVCALFFVTGCNSDKFTIDGYISGMADQDVYLYVDPHGGDQPLDTARMENGHFRFTGKIKGSDYRFITFQDIAGEIRLYIDNSRMKITGDFARLDSVKVTGSPAMDYYNSFLEEERKNNLYLNDKIAAFTSAQQAGDTTAMMAIQEEVIGYREAYARKVLEKVNTRPDDLLSLVVMSKWFGFLNPDQVADFYRKVPDALKTDPRMGTFDDFMKQTILKVAKGSPAPDFKLPLLGSAADTLTMDSLRGKVSVLYVTTSEQIPDNDRMYSQLRKAREKGAQAVLVFMFLDQNPPAGIEDYLKEHELTGIPAVLGDVIFTRTFVTPSPRMLFIDAEGKYLGTALKPEDAEELVERL